MKSRTSFFNFTAFRKNITRFAPVWALYTIFMLLFLFGVTELNPGIFAQELTESMGPLGWYNFFYAGVCAFCLFGDLFNSRLCNALHAFPMRREGWLLTNIASGVLFSLGPNLVFCLLGCAVMGENSFVAFLWLLTSTLQFLFFFGTAALSAVCAGNRLAMAAIYSIIHFITLLVYAVWEVLYQPLLYGVQVDTQDFFKFFPLSQFASAEYLDYVYMSIHQTYHFNDFIPESWRHLSLCAGVGVVSLVLAWLVYRRRQLENAGDFISLRHLSPVFLYIYTIGVGIVLYVFSGIFGNESEVFLVVGLLVGYFTGRMLLGRTVRVFNKKSFIGFAVLVILLAGSMGLTKLDPLGVSSRIPGVYDPYGSSGFIPDGDEVESVAVYDMSNTYIYQSNKDFYSFEYTQKEEIAKVQEFHAKLLKAGDAGEYNTVEVTIRYTLKNGKQVYRFYHIDPDSELGLIAKQYFSDMRYLFQVEDPKDLDTIVTYVRADTDEEEGTPKHITSKDSGWIAGLLNAIEADCKEGTTAQYWAFDSKGSNSISVEFMFLDMTYKDAQGQPRQRYASDWVYIDEDCVNAYAYLQEAFALGKDDVP